MRYLSVILLTLLVVGCGQLPAMMARYEPVGYWIEALHEADARVRRKAVDVLGKVGSADPAVLPALVGSLKDRDPEVRRKALVAFMKMGAAAKDAVPTVAAATRNTDPKVRSYAAKAPERIQGN
jgi:HEAT repeat protein